MTTLIKVKAILSCILFPAVCSFASVSQTIQTSPKIKPAVYEALNPPFAASAVHNNQKHAALLEKLRDHARSSGIVEPADQAFRGKANAASAALQKLKSFEMPRVYDPNQKIVLHAAKENTYRVGDTLRINWQAGQRIHQVCIELSLDGGNSWLPLGRQASNGTRKAFKWVVPQLIEKKMTVSEQCMMRIRSADFLHKAISDSFQIKPQQSAAAN